MGKENYVGWKHSPWLRAAFHHRGRGELETGGAGPASWRRHPGGRLDRQRGGGGNGVLGRRRTLRGPAGVVHCRACPLGLEDGVGGSDSLHHTSALSKCLPETPGSVSRLKISKL